MTRKPYNNENPKVCGHTGQNVGCHYCLFQCPYYAGGGTYIDGRLYVDCSFAIKSRELQAI